MRSAWLHKASSLSLRRPQVRAITSGKVNRLRYIDVSAHAALQAPRVVEPEGSPYLVTIQDQETSATHPGGSPLHSPLPPNQTPFGKKPGRWMMHKIS